MKKKTEVVKFDNFLQQLRLKNFERGDLDMFFAICFRLMDMGETEQVFKYDDIMSLINYDRRRTVARFHQDLRRMNEKLAGVFVSIDWDEYKSDTIVLFTEFHRDLKARTLTVSINKRFTFLLNDLTGGFTEFELKEYVSLDKKYAKNLYQHLKRFTRKGKKSDSKWWEVQIDEFRTVMDIADSMPNYNIMSKVIKPSIEAIQKCRGFSDLQVEVMRDINRGRSITGYRFSWDHGDNMTLADWQKQQKKQGGKKKDANGKIEKSPTYDNDNMGALEKTLLAN